MSEQVVKTGLHRSITFWSGIFVIGSIFWLSYDSWKHSTVVMFPKDQYVSSYRGGLFWIFSERPNPGSGFSFTVVDELGFQRNPFPDAPLPPLWRLWQTHEGPFVLHGREEDGSAQVVSPPPFGPDCPTKNGSWQDMGPYARGSRLVFLPHWVLLLGFALPWLALLLWRAQRRKIKPAEIASATA